MSPEIARRLQRFREIVSQQVRWCSDERFVEEHALGASPGGDLAPFGWHVVGATIGGNAVVIREGDPGVYFADHTSYSDDEVCYPTADGNGWTSEPLSAASVRRSLVLLASTDEEFVRLARSGEMDGLIDSLD